MKSSVQATDSNSVFDSTLADLAAWSGENVKSLQESITPFETQLAEGRRSIKGL